MESRFGGLSVAVPGELKGVWEMHSRWGKAKWGRLFEPSIRMAKGWKVGTELARRLQVRVGRAVTHDKLLNSFDIVSG